MAHRNDESAGRQEDYGRYGMARDRQDQGRYGAAPGGEQRSWGDNSYSDLQQPRSQGAYGSIAHGASNQPGGGGFSGGAAGGYGGFGGHGSQGGQGGYGPINQGSSYGQDSSAFGRSSGPYDDRGGGQGYGHSNYGQGQYDQGRQWGDDRYSSFSAGNPQHDPGGGYGPQAGPFTGQGGYGWARGQAGGTYGQNDYSQAAQRSHWRTDQGPERDRYPSQSYGQPASDPYGQGGAGQFGAGGQSSEHHHDPHYRQWRDQQLSGHDRDYAHWREQQAQRYDNEYKSWRDERHQAFSKDFDSWRSSRSEQNAKGAGGQSLSDLHTGVAEASAGQAAVEDVTDGGVGRHDDKEHREEKH